MTKQSMPKHNGTYHIVLLAGGPRDLARKIRDKLARVRDVFVKYHVEYDKDKPWDRPIPKDVDFVIVLKDMISHSKFAKIKKACQVAGVRPVVTQSELSTMFMALHNYKVHKTAGLPLVVSSTAYFDDSEPSIPALSQIKPPPPVAEPQAMELPESKPSTVNILVHSVVVPEGMTPTPRKGCPRPETMILIAALQQAVQDDSISVMITPTGITIDPA